MKQSLKPIRRRIRILRLLQGLLWGLLLGLAAWFALSLVAFFVPIEGFWTYAGVTMGACVLLGALAGALWPVSYMQAARRADATGLKERAQTALALTGDETPIAQLQREDAKRALSRLDIAGAMPVRFDARRLITCGCLALGILAMALLPNPQDAVLRQREAVRQDLRAQADSLEKAAETMAEQDGLTREEARELRRITAEMARELRVARDKREALLGIDKHQADMDRLQQNIQQRLTAQTAAAMAGQPDLGGLAKALEEGTETDLAKALEETAQKMMESDASLQAFANQLVEAALAAPEGDVAQYLMDSANAALGGDATESVSSLAASLAASKGTGGKSSNVGALMSSAKSGSMSGSADAKEVTVRINLPMSGGSMGGSGQGGGGSGSGQGQGGGGAGKGSTNEDQGYTPQLTNWDGYEGGKGAQDKMGTYERIYDPTRLGGDGDIEQVEGEMRDGETQQITLGPGAGSFDGYIPYNEVIGEYRDAASQAMRRVQLPSALQGFVDQYFDALID